MNFQMAADMLAAEGIHVEQVVINDDVAVEDSLYTAGRRGVGGTVLAEKIVGAKLRKAERWKKSRGCASMWKTNVRSMGMALSPCTVRSESPRLNLSPDEMK